jgi:hypothetical protein
MAEQDEILVVSPSDRKPGPSTPGMDRQQAVATDGMWSGVARTRGRHGVRLASSQRVRDDDLCGTVALSRNAPGKPSKVEALLHGRTPRRGRTTRPCHDLSSLSGEVEAVARGDRSMQQCPAPAPGRSPWCGDVECSTRLWRRSPPLPRRLLSWSFSRSFQVNPGDDFPNQADSSVVAWLSRLPGGRSGGCLIRR